MHIFFLSDKKNVFYLNMRIHFFLRIFSIYAHLGVSIQKKHFLLIFVSLYVAINGASFRDEYGLVQQQKKTVLYVM